jgi:hypothetical protein
LVLYFNILFFEPEIKGSKIDSDSLLSVIIKDMKNGKNYEQNIQRGLIAKKIAQLP